MRIVVGFFLSAILSLSASAQTRFSVGTDISVLRQLGKEQSFWAFGQTIRGSFHFAPQDGAYASASYFSEGRFGVNYTAMAAAPTVPQSRSYRVNSTWNRRSISLGWQHYFKGSFSEQRDWNLYGRAGFGLLFTQIENNFEGLGDTTVYKITEGPSQASGTYKALTLDLGLGVEYPLASNLFVYGEGRTALPASSTPTPLLHQNSKVSRAVWLGAGLRILFDFNY